MLTVVTSAFLALACGSQSKDPAESAKPRALVAMEESRRAIASGDIQWSVLPEGDDDKAISFMSRYAQSGDMIFENRGDRDGWTVVNADGAGAMKYPQIYLNNADGSWHRQETGLHCMWWKKDGHPSPWSQSVKDVRNVGICVSAFSVNQDMGFRAVWDTPGYRVTEWEEKRVGDLYEVTGRCQTGAVMRWYINPGKGWNAEHIEFEHAGVYQEAICTLKQYGDAWLPETTDFFENGRLTETIQIRSAELNRPSDPKRFTPGDMGVEAGTRFSMQNVRTEPGGAMFWNGEDVASEESWNDDVRSGKRQWGPTFRRLHAGGNFSSPYDTEEQRNAREITRRQLAGRRELTKDRGLWEKYVRDFIAKYKLDAEQAKQATRILDMCQKRADDVFKKHRPEMIAVINELHAAQSAKDQGKASALMERLTKLRDPIEKIFQEELKPRLEKLPTRAQRQAAEAAAATTKPAEPGAPKSPEDKP